jgi:YVTN family beta-propeller protein
MKINNILKSLLIAILFITSCSDEDESPSFLSNVLVINEGNFLSAEGSITGFNSTTKMVEENLYESANGFAISATIQRVETFNNSYYVTTNNPDKLEYINGETLQMLATISNGLTTPYSFAASGNTGFITNWGTFNNTTFQYDDPYLAVVDLSSFIISSTINWDFQPQDLQVIDNKLYVTNVNANSVSVMNISTLEIIETIETPYGPDKMEVDANGNIWIICNSGFLIKIDPATNEVVTTVSDVVTSGFNEKMVFNAAKDKIYYLSTVYDANFNSTTDVFEFAITDSSAPSTSIVTGSSFYGVGIDANNILYIGDHNNYQGNGTVYRYTIEGEELDNFESGINPNGFVFR